MQFIEMVAWFTFGFAPTLGIGNFIWSWLRKRNDNKEPIPWEV